MPPRKAASTKKKAAGKKTWGFAGTVTPSSSKKKSAASPAAARRPALVASAAAAAATAAPGEVFIARVDSVGQFGESTEIIGVYADPTEAAEAVRTHLDQFGGQDDSSCEEYEETLDKHGWPYIEARGWEGEQFTIYMSRSTVQPSRGTKKKTRAAPASATSTPAAVSTSAPPPPAAAASSRKRKAEGADDADEDKEASGGVFIVSVLYESPTLGDETVILGEYNSEAEAAKAVRNYIKPKAPGVGRRDELPDENGWPWIRATISKPATTVTANVTMSRKTDWRDLSVHTDARKQKRARGDDSHSEEAPAAAASTATTSVTPSEVFVALADHLGKCDFTEILGVYADAVSAATKVNSYIDTDWGGHADLEKCNSKVDENGWPIVEAYGLEGEFVKLYVKRHPIQFAPSPAALAPAAQSSGGRKKSARGKAAQAKEATPMPLPASSSNQVFIVSIDHSGPERTPFTEIVGIYADSVTASAKVYTCLDAWQEGKTLERYSSSDENDPPLVEAEEREGGREIVKAYMKRYEVHSPSAASTTSEVDPWIVVKKGNAGKGMPRTILGEGPVWSCAAQCLYWLDIEGKRLHRFTPSPEDTTGAKGEHVSVDLAHLGMASCIALTECEDQILLACQAGLVLFDWITLRSRVLHAFPGDAKIARFNDGGVTPAGTLIVGTMLLDEELGKTKGELVEFAWDAETKSVRCEVRATGTSIPNGLDFDVGQRQMYFIDTPLQRVDLFDFDASNSKAAPAAASSSSAAATASSTPSPLSNRRVAFPIDLSNGFPDGMTVDALGRLWIAHWAGARVTCWTREGKLLKTIRLPADNITAPCFGGPDLQHLYVTSASRDVDLKKSPLAGSLFVLLAGAQGRPALKFRGELDQAADTETAQHQLERA